MHDQIGSNNESDVIPFARGAKSTTDGNDQLDAAGRTILDLVQRAAGGRQACRRLASGAWLYSAGHPVLHLNGISHTDKQQRDDSGVIDHIE